MSKIDVLSQICVFVDFPLWRNWIKKYRNKFNKVILYASRHHGVVDLESFWREKLPETWVSKEIDWTTPGIDWRQIETIPLIDESTSEWLLFMEADFFCDNWDKLWLDVEKAIETSDAIGWWNPTNFPYLHPCFLLIKKEILDKTQKDFRAHPEIDGGDHFAMITHDLEKIGAKITKLQDLGWTEPEHAFHLGGLTYPLQDFKGDETIIGVKYPEALHMYIKTILGCELNSEFRELVIKLDQVLNKKYISADSKWEKFFKL